MHQTTCHGDPPVGNITHNELHPCSVNANRGGRPTMSKNKVWKFDELLLNVSLASSVYRPGLFVFILLLSLERLGCQEERQRSAFLFLVPAKMQMRLSCRGRDTLWGHKHGVCVCVFNTNTAALTDTYNFV